MRDRGEGRYSEDDDSGYLRPPSKSSNILFQSGSTKVDRGTRVPKRWSIWTGPAASIPNTRSLQFFQFVLLPLTELLICLLLPFRISVASSGDAGGGVCSALSRCCDVPLAPTG